MKSLPLLSQQIDQTNLQKANSWQISSCGLSLDFCRELIQPSEFKKLFNLLGDWQQIREAMFSGEIVNISEQRAASHVSLRANQQLTFPHEQFNVGTPEQLSEIKRQQQRQHQFAEQIKSCEYNQLIHIGIGGSDLGPRLLCQTLGEQDGQSRYKLSFIASVDAHYLQQVLKTAEAKKTLIFIASKTFTTQETMQNAQIVRQWLINSGADYSKQCLALTANIQAARSWGIAAENIFPFADTVGGRYSLWSSVALVARVYCGNLAFAQLLAGAAALDQHFCTAKAEENLPVVAALLDYWNRQNLNIVSRMVAAYDSRLSLLVPYLQQLYMESLGKQVDKYGNKLNKPSSAILWGDIGTNCQHAFFQQLHQGDQTVAGEFIGVLSADHPYPANHQANLANLLSQAEALSHGYSAQQIIAANSTLTSNQANERSCRGGHPVSILWLNKLDAFHLGALLAFWEHRTFIYAHLLNINPFDQWGVERGKMIANKLLPLLLDQQQILPNDLLPETAAAIKFIREMSK